MNKNGNLNTKDTCKSHVEQTKLTNERSLNDNNFFFQVDNK